MKFSIIHCNINVFDLDKSLKFYEEALGLSVVERVTADDGSFELVFLSDEQNLFQIELTWLRDKNEPYNLGDNKSHIAFRTDDMDAARALHEKMGCICYENKKMGMYLISDPDGYLLEIFPIK